MNITIIFITLSSYYLHIYIVHIITLIYMISLLLILLGQSTHRVPGGQDLATLLYGQALL